MSRWIGTVSKEVRKYRKCTFAATHSNWWLWACNWLTMFLKTTSAAGRVRTSHGIRLSPVVSPSKRLASIQVVSSGYSTNLTSSSSSRSSKSSSRSQLTTGQSPDVPLSSAGQAASPWSRNNYIFPTFSVMLLMIFKLSWRWHSVSFVFPPPCSVASG